MKGTCRINEDHYGELCDVCDCCKKCCECKDGGDWEDRRNMFKDDGE